MIEVSSLIDKRLLTTLAQMSVTPQGQSVLAWLEACRMKQMEELIHLADTRAFQVAQGAAQAFESLAEAITSAKPLLEQTDQRS